MFLTIYRAAFTWDGVEVGVGEVDKAFLAARTGMVL